MLKSCVIEARLNQLLFKVIRQQRSHKVAEKPNYNNLKEKNITLERKIKCIHSIWLPLNW